MENNLTTFYVSLVNDMRGVYLAFEADSEFAVRAHLARQYRAPNGEWKLPWCSVYTQIPDCEVDPEIIRARCSPLYKHQFQKGAA